MNREQREQIWISLGLQGALELMDAACSMAERLTEEHVNNRTLTHELMFSIANEIISKRE